MSFLSQIFAIMLYSIIFFRICEGISRNTGGKLKYFFNLVLHNQSYKYYQQEEKKKFFIVDQISYEKIKHIYYFF